ncbi:hypothetical protein ACOKM3_06900 [Streptomyces sp. BH106]|uniref:hypothetical protein n=1 Tax=Streptomyces sp. BH106 TaxID=3410409 RepID=UPI003CFA9D3B
MGRLLLCRGALPPLTRLTDRQLVRANAALHVTARAALATGVAPRPAAVALAGGGRSRRDARARAAVGSASSVLLPRTPTPVSRLVNSS